MRSHTLAVNAVREVESSVKHVSQVTSVRPNDIKLSGERSESAAALLGGRLRFVKCLPVWSYVGRH